GIRDFHVTGVQTCALPICSVRHEDVRSAKVKRQTAQEMAMQINDPFELILFGGLGDLARRKLLPALYLLHRDGRLGEGIICAVTRQQLDTDEFLARIEQALQQYVPADCLEPQHWQAFSARLRCVTLDLQQPEQYRQ